jgi:regulator of sirC expression with transglutaminase-like and TPR domain
MPVLYLALGRRLGYPLKLVTTRQHLFLRWDSPTEKFNLEATGKGMERYEDAHYRQWPFPISEQEIKEQDYLKSLSPREELSVFLSMRGACLTEAGRLAEATASYEAAYRYAPNWKGNQVLLAEARQRQTMLSARQPSVTAATPTVPTAFNPIHQTQNPKRKP